MATEPFRSARYYVSTFEQLAEFLADLNVRGDQGARLLNLVDPSSLDGTCAIAKALKREFELEPLPISSQATSRYETTFNLIAADAFAHATTTGVLQPGAPNRGEDQEALYLRLRPGHGGEVRVYHKTKDYRWSLGCMDHPTFIGALLDSPASGSPTVVICGLEHRENAILSAKTAFAMGQHSARKCSDVVLLSFVSEPISDSRSKQEFLFGSAHVVIDGSRDVPSRSFYDHIYCFTSHLWDSFEAKQKQAGIYLASVVAELHEVNRVLDIGAGTGEILSVIHHEHPRLKCFGVDPSQRMHTGGHGASVAFKRIALPTPSRQGDLPLESDEMYNDLSGFLEGKWADCVVLFTGNTLSHIGARGLRFWLRWLQNKGDGMPRYVLFDFSHLWLGMFNSSNDGIVLSPAIRKNVGRFELEGIFSIVRQPNKLRRTVSARWRHTSALETDDMDWCANDFASVEQFADLPTAYLETFRAFGYQIAARGQYESGWATNDLYLAEATTDIPEPGWPSPSDSVQKRLNDEWYEFLVKLWDGLHREDRDGQGVFLPHAELFPIAILPLGNGALWARCVPRTKDRSSQSQGIFDVWQQMISPNAKSVPAEGAVKPEEAPVYAPGIFNAMLADVPASIVQQVDVAQYRLSLNDADRRFIESEAQWFGRTEDRATGFFVLPIYLWSCPVFCVVVKVSDTGWPPALLHQVLLQEKEALVNDLATAWSNTALETVVRKWLGSDVQPSDVVEAFAGIHSGERQWKSWLDTLPGKSLLDNPKHKDSWDTFVGKINRIVDEAKQAPYAQISLRFHAARFFARCSQEGGCGHEFVTELHQKAAGGLAKDLFQFGVENAYVSKALELLRAIEKASGLPRDDSETSTSDQRRSKDAFGSANFAFQVLKSLFCRASENTSNQYRLSALMMFKSGVVLNGAQSQKVTLRGDKDPKYFNEREHVGIKVARPNAWEFLQQMWDIISLGSVKSCDIGNQFDIQAIQVKVLFHAAFSLASGGSTTNRLLDVLGRMLPSDLKVPAIKVKGFELRICDPQAIDEQIDRGISINWLVDPPEASSVARHALKSKSPRRRTARTAARRPPSG